MKSNIYDYVVIGSGLSGLSVATAISQETPSVLLVEALDHVGGQNFPQSRFAEVPSVGLRYLPDSELAHKSLAFLSQITGEAISWQSRASQPITFENGAFRPFLGFGSQPPAFYDQLAYFLAPQELQVGPPVTQWIEILMKSFKGEVALKSLATRLQIVDGRADSLLINGGQKSIKAHNFIFAGTLKQLMTLLPEEALNSRSRQKLSKGPYWTAIGLDLYFSEKISDSQELHVLNGTTVDEIGPCIGRFFEPTPQQDGLIQMSQWMTFVDTEDAEDNERVGEILKKVKRQIKRAYPTALDKIKFERIQVVPSLAGSGELRLSSNQSLPLAANVWVASAALHPQKNLLGSLLQAEMVVSALGCFTGQELNLTPEIADLTDSDPHATPSLL